MSEEQGLEEPPSKMMMMDDSEYSRQPPELTPAPSPAAIGFNSSLEILSLPSRPPPPLKAANRSQGQSLLKNNPTSSLSTSAASVTISVPAATTVTATSSAEEAKRTLWKCKRCNYRDSSKEAVLLHVKSHYETSPPADDGEKVGFGWISFASSTSRS